jgi:anti-sigma B factor antagonist
LNPPVATLGERTSGRKTPGSGQRLDRETPVSGISPSPERHGLRTVRLLLHFLSEPPKGKILTMNIVERLVGDVTIIDLQGKIMIGEGDEALRDAVNKAIDSGKNKLVLNLAEVPYVDSAGLGELVRCYSTVNKKGGKLKLLNLTKKIQDLLAITKLLTVFETFDSEDEAVKSFA